MDIRSKFPNLTFIESTKQLDFFFNSMSKRDIREYLYEEEFTFYTELSKRKIESVIDAQKLFLAYSFECDQNIDSFTTQSFTRNIKECCVIPFKEKRKNNTYCSNKIFIFESLFKDEVHFKLDAIYFELFLFKLLVLITSNSSFKFNFSLIDEFKNSQFIEEIRGLSVPLLLKLIKFIEMKLNVKNTGNYKKKF